MESNRFRVPIGNMQCKEEILHAKYSKNYSKHIAKVHYITTTKVLYNISKGVNRGQIIFKSDPTFDFGVKFDNLGCVHFSRYFGL